MVRLWGTLRRPARLHRSYRALKNVTITRNPVQTRLGLGDAVAAVATPIARALHLPCIDPATKQLRPESGCAKRKARLNAAVPNVNPLAAPQMQPPGDPGAK